MSAMVIGSMVPDVPLLLRWPDGYGFSHSFAGVLTVNLVATVVLLYVWNTVMRDALVDLAPGPLRYRLPARHRLSPRDWLLTPAAAILGSMTHVVWDAFTHRNRWGVAHFDWLQADLGPLAGFKWAQYSSGVIGLLVVLGAIVSFLRSRPAGRTPGPRVLPAPVLPLAVAAAMAYSLLAGLERANRGLHAVAFHGAIAGIVALTCATTVTCLLWVLLAPRREVTRHASAP
jgi:hypothetical protein